MLPIPSLERGTTQTAVASNVGPASTPTKPPPKCWCPIAAPGKLDVCPNSDRLNPGRAFYKCARVPSCSFFAWRDSNEEYKRMKEENNKQSAQPPAPTTPAPQQQQKPTTISLLSSEVKASAIAPPIDNKPSVQAVVRPPTTPTTIKKLEPLPLSPRILPRKLEFDSIEKKKKEDKKKKRKEKLRKLYWVDSEDEEEEEEDDEETEGVAIEVTAQPRPYTSSPPIPIPRRKVCCIDSLAQNSRERLLLNQQRQVY